MMKHFNCEEKDNRLKFCKVYLLLLFSLFGNVMMGVGDIFGLYAAKEIKKW